MHDLMKFVEKKRAILVIAGNSRGIPAWRAGSPLRKLAEMLKGAVSSPAPIPGGGRGNVMSSLEDGEGGGVLGELAKHGKLRVSKTRDDAIDQMIRDWVAAKDLAPEDRVLIATSRVDAARMSHMAQWLRVQAGELDRRSGINVGPQKIPQRHGPTQVLPKTFFGKSGRHRGDRVRFTRGSVADGIRAGDRGVVERVNWRLRTVTVRLDRTVPLHLGVIGTFDRAVRVTIWAHDAKKHLELDYAVTPEQMEGRRCKRIFALAEPDVRAHEHMYANLEREGIDLLVYADRGTAGEKLETLARSLSRPNPNLLAQELVDESKRPEQAGPVMEM